MYTTNMACSRSRNDAITTKTDCELPLRDWGKSALPSGRETAVLDRYPRRPDVSLRPRNGNARANLPGTDGRRLHHSAGWFVVALHGPGDGSLLARWHDHDGDRRDCSRAYFPFQ